LAVSITIQEISLSPLDEVRTSERRTFSCMKRHRRLCCTVVDFVNGVCIRGVSGSWGGCMADLEMVPRYRRQSDLEESAFVEVTCCDGYNLENSQADSSPHHDGHQICREEAHAQ
jgi:hypothetical protein